MKADSPAKVAVITGASSGIGAACAEAFAAAGFSLMLGARRTDRLEHAAAHLKDLGAPKVVYAALDVRDLKAIERFHADTIEHFADIDLLLNNAGLAAGLDPVATSSDDDWAAMMDTNVTGLLRVTRAFLPAMIKKKHGHIINMGSIASFHTYANGAAYAGSKHAVRAISGALRLELSGTAIRVSEIDPGMVETEFSLVRLRSASEAAAVYQGMKPLSAKDIADCVLFAATRPPHVNVDHIIVMPTQQASVYKVDRSGT